jgi:glutathione S-transferase
MILYDHPLSPYAQKVRIMLREKGVAFDARIPDGLGSGDGGDYALHNPRLEVPALVVGSMTIYDSSVILEYLEDRFPDPALRPADPLRCAQCRMIEEVCDTHFEAINWGLGELRFFGRGNGIAEDLRRVAAKETAILHRWLERLIHANGWLSGDAYGWADLVAVPYVTMSQIFGVGPAPDSALNPWIDRVMARPAVATTIGEAAASVAGMEHYAGLLDSGAFRRQFRDHRLEWMIRAGGMQVVLDGIAKDNVRFTDLAMFDR